MGDSLEVEVRILDIETGKPIVILNEKDASRRSIFLGDRIKISADGREIVAIVDLSKKVPEGEMVLFQEAGEKLSVEGGATVRVELAVKPDSINYIKKRIRGEPLNKDEVKSLIRDTVNFLVTDPELMAYTVALKMSEFSFEETQYLAEAMVETGERIDIENALDKHCIGGVPGNRTTPIIVSIVAAAGYRIPKTSSRAISSPAGTADTMEVLCNVEHSASELKDIVNRTKGCIVWGGGVNLAPADDEFIRVREALSLDPMEQVLSSVLAKKKSVGSDTVLIDIPIGEEAKVQSKEEANKLSKYFKKLGRKLGMSVVTLISGGSQPVGNGLGPALETRDMLKILESQGEKGPEDLKEKAVKMSNILLDEAGSKRNAEEVLEEGKAYEKFKEIVKAQEGEVPSWEDVKLGDQKKTITSEKRGRVGKIHSSVVSKIARAAGCPKEKKSGIYLHKKVGDPVEEGDDLFTIYSENEKRLNKAVRKAEENKLYEFESFLSEKFK